MLFVCKVLTALRVVCGDVTHERCGDVTHERCGGVTHERCGGVTAYVSGVKSPQELQRDYCLSACHAASKKRRAVPCVPCQFRKDLVI